MMNGARSDLEVTTPEELQQTLINVSCGHKKAIPVETVGPFKMPSDVYGQERR